MRFFPDTKVPHTHIDMRMRYFVVSLFLAFAEQFFYWYAPNTLFLRLYDRVSVRVIFSREHAPLFPFVSSDIENVFLPFFKSCLIQKNCSFPSCYGVKRTV